MHDIQLEDRLRTALRAEGDALPFTITAEELERRLEERRRGQLTRRSGLAAAAVFALLALGGTAMFLANRGPLPNVATSPSPSAPHPTGLVIPDHLSWGASERVLDVSSDDRPVLEAPSPTAGERVVGRLPAAPEYDLAWVCDGAGTMVVRLPQVDSQPIACNGVPEYRRFSVLSADAGYDLRVVADHGTAWRVIAHRPGAPMPSQSFPTELATADELLAAAGDGATSSLTGERAGDAGGDAPAEVVVGTFRSDGFGDIVWHCSGDGPFAMALTDEVTGDEGGRFEVDGCPDVPQAVTLADLPAEVRLTVTASRSTSWRLLVFDPGAPPSTLPDIAPSGEGTVAVDEQHDGTDGEGNVTRHLGQIPAADGYVLSAVCLGSGDMTFRLGGDAVSAQVGGGALATCDGTPARHSLGTPSTVALPLTVTAPADAQWRVIVEVVGEAEVPGRAALGTPDQAVVVGLEGRGPDLQAIHVGVLRLDADAFDGAVEPEEVFVASGAIVPDGYTIAAGPHRASAHGWVALPLTPDSGEGLTDILIFHPRDSEATAWVVKGNLGHAGWGPQGWLAVSTGSAVTIHDPVTRTSDTVTVPDLWTVGHDWMFETDEAPRLGVEAVTWFADGRRILAFHRSEVPSIGALSLDGSAELLESPVPIYERSGTEREYNADGRLFSHGCPTEGGGEGCETSVQGGHADSETWLTEADGLGFHGDAIWDADGDAAWMLLGRGETDEGTLVAVASLAGRRQLTDIAEFVVPAETAAARPQRFAAVRDVGTGSDGAVLLVQRWDGRLAVAVRGDGRVAEVLGDWHFAGWAGPQEAWPAP